jgi:transmembrane sensor
MADISKYHFNKILKKYRDGSASKEEIAFLESFYNMFDVNDDFVDDGNEDSHIQLKHNIKRGIDEQINLYENKSVNTRFKFLYTKYAVAASIVVFLSVATYFFLKPAGNEKVAATYTTIRPGGNKAILTLAGGKTIVLDNAGHGEIARQAGISIHKTADGMLVYEAKADNGDATVQSNRIFQNTISTPMGGQYMIVLPDGTKVMLNAASSLKYPVEFLGSERTVELNGEAYFEVTKNKHKPFKVKSGIQTIEVLGTHFNVNAYHDEAAIKTTLLEGSVKVAAGTNTGLIVPGQQCVVATQTGNLFKRNVNLEKETAWKNGVFAFENDDLKAVMRQVARWYDVDVEYAGSFPDQKFFGEISRSSNLSDVFKILEINNVHFAIKGKTVVVSYNP